MGWLVSCGPQVALLGLAAVSFGCVGSIVCVLSLVTVVVVPVATEP